MTIAVANQIESDRTCLIPPDERARLQALLELDILDTPAEATFDAVAHIAASLCGTPIALISLIDTSRQWPKACVGMSPFETPRQAAFCAYAILGRELLEVTDALLEPQFSGSPLVTGDPGIRFYAGMPLVTGDGFALGTLCVMDCVPRTLEAHQRKSLQDLAVLATAMLEARRAAVQASQLGLILNEVFEEIMVLHPGSQQIQYANGKVLSNLGYSMAELQKATIASVGEGYPGEKLREMCSARNAVWRGPLTFEAVNKRRDGSAYEVEVHATISSSQDSPQLILLANDISKRKQGEALLRRQADFDATTGLPNRQSLVRMLENAMQRARRERGALALVMLEIERLTEIRHCHGQQVTGSVLGDFARRLKGCATAKNPVAYLGGDEFAILVADVSDPVYVPKLVDGIRKNLERCYSSGHRQIPLAANIGVAYFRGGAESVGTFLERADAAVNVAFLNGTHQHIPPPATNRPTPGVPDPAPSPAMVPPGWRSMSPSARATS